jgi:hypothetical protein
VIGRGRKASVTPLEPAEAALSAVRRAEQAAEARLAAETANRAEILTAHRQAEELVRNAQRRAEALAEQRRQTIRAEFDALTAQEQAAGSDELDRVLKSAHEHEDAAVRRAVTFVLTGEASPCSS